MHEDQDGSWRSGGGRREDVEALPRIAALGLVAHNFDIVVWPFLLQWLEELGCWRVDYRTDLLDGGGNLGGHLAGNGACHRLAGEGGQRAQNKKSHDD
jgi:hypothetical protein